MSTIAELERVEREISAEASLDRVEYLRRWADTIAAFIAAQRTPKPAPMLYRHDKTGKVYRFIWAALDTTNARDGAPVVIYQEHPTGTVVFVRDEDEFDEKFTLISDPPKESSDGAR